MAGFMAGFGSSLSKGIDAAVKAKQEEEKDSFRLTFQTYLSRKEKLDLKEQEQAKMATRAKEYAEMYGQDASTAREIYGWLDSGVSDVAVQDRLEKYRITPVEGAPAPDRVDTQMASSGLDPRADMASATNADDPMRRTVDRSIGRIAEMTGETPDAVSGVLSGRSKTPDIGDGKVGSFKLVPKEKSPDKLTDAEIAAEYTRLQMDVKAGKPGAENALEVFETVKLPSYQAAKASLETPSGDNVLPDLFLRYQQAPEGSPERARYAARIEAHRRAVQLKQGNSDNGFQPSVVFLEDGTTDIRPVKSIVDEQGNRAFVGIENGKQVRIDATVQAITEDQRKEIQAIYQERNGEISKHEDRLANTADAVRLSQQVFDIVDSEPKVLTTTAKVASSTASVVREVFAATDVLGEIAQRNGQVTQAEIEQALGGSLSSIEARIDRALGEGVMDLAQKRALLDSKILLAGFRLGGLEGQSGNGLSNQDYERILSIVNASSDPATFKTAWRDYVKGRIEQVDMWADVANNHNARIQNFEKMNGFRPVDKVVTSLTDYIAQSGDKELQKAARSVLEIGGSDEAWVDPKYSGTMPVGLEGLPSDLPKAAPEAGKLLGRTKDGRRVFELPDGRKVVRAP